MDKEKDYGKVKSFRLNEKTEKLLMECFKFVHAIGPNFNSQMSDFISKLHYKLKESEDQQNRIAELEEQIQKLKEDLKPPAFEIQNVKPLEKPSLSTNKSYEQYKKDLQETKPKETTPKTVKDNLIPCPLKDEWVTQPQCELCRTTNYKAWAICFNERFKNPKSPIFNISKPKPSL